MKVMGNCTAAANVSWRLTELLTSSRYNVGMKLFLPLILTAALLSACSSETGTTAPPDTTTPSTGTGAVTDKTAPTVSLKATPSPLTTTQPLVLEATAADDTGVARVEFYRGTTLISSATTAPYRASVTGLSRADNGPLTFTARAYDAAGNIASADTTVTAAITTLYQGRWTWKAADAGSGNVVDSGTITFDNEISQDGRVAALGRYSSVGGQSGRAVLGPIAADGNLQVILAVGDSLTGYIAAQDADNTLTNSTFDGIGTLVGTNNQIGQILHVTMQQMSTQP